MNHSSAVQSILSRRGSSFELDQRSPDQKAYDKWLAKVKDEFSTLYGVALYPGARVWDEQQIEQSWDNRDKPLKRSKMLGDNWGLEVREA